ncbi:MAG: nuclear transport factor 2 family protein [Chitinophagales bacterium]|nr:nuclear transport factor 2 family protein [Chitinophagales bacterium]
MVTFFYFRAMRNIIILFTIIILFQACSNNIGNDVAEITKVMNEQVAAWNNGDITTYMQGYWNNDSLQFIGSKGPKYGYQTTLENYQRSYPDKAAMGELHFSSLQYKRLSNEYYYVTGAWSLTREKDNPHGYFTLLFRKVNDKWVIIADHSS